MEDYISRFGLEFNPFLKNARETIIENGELREVRLRLRYLAQIRGFGLLTGSPGLGKTTALRLFAASLNPASYQVIYTGLSTLTVMEFYRLLASSLGAEPSCRKVDNFRLIQDAVTRLSIEKRKTPVFLIDEANYISNAILNDLKLLFNFEMDSKDRAVILLCGGPQMIHTLNLSTHEALRQRLVMNYHMDGLTKEEGLSYISGKLKGAGCRVPVFEENALQAVLNAAGGTPRIINRICDACLLTAHTLGLNTVTADAAMQAVNDTQLG